jgi:hypothetical protein
VSDRVHAAVQQPEPSRSHAACDGARAQAEGEQLPASDDAELAVGQFGDPALRRVGRWDVQVSHTDT